MRAPMVPEALSEADAAEELRLEQAAAFARDVELVAHDIRVRDAARAKVAAERSADLPGFDAGSLGEILARPPSPPFRVEGLIPSGASTLVVAQRKTGKTTLTLNLAKTLLEGGEFLGRFHAEPMAGNVVLLNFEVDGEMAGRWADEADLPHERFHLVNLRGRRNPFAFEEDRARLAELLRGWGVETLIVDPFTRAYTGKSENDAGEVGSFLAELDTFARSEVGAEDLILTAHAGWDSDRSRGSSALEGWPDVFITMTRDKDDDQVRYLSAEGRDVLVEEGRLDYDPLTRSLTLAGAGSRRQARASKKRAELGQVILEIVTENPGIKTGGLEAALREQGTGFQRGDVGQAGRELVASGHLRSEHGPRNAVLWFPGNGLVLPSTPESSRREHVSSPESSLYRRTTHRSTEDSTAPGAPEPLSIEAVR